MFGGSVTIVRERGLIIPCPSCHRRKPHASFRVLGKIVAYACGCGVVFRSVSREAKWGAMPIGTCQEFERVPQVRYDPRAGAFSLNTRKLLQCPG